ncbi:MAG: hypothetical protein ACW96M_07695 [Candidatus Thorarchaeota archaeon]
MVELQVDSEETENEKEELIFSFHPDNLPEEIRSNPPLKKETKFDWDESVALSNMSVLTEDELIELIPDDYRENNDLKKLKTLTKEELISLIELLRFRDTL